MQFTGIQATGGKDTRVDSLRSARHSAEPGKPIPATTRRQSQYRPAATRRCQPKLDPLGLFHFRACLVVAVGKKSEQRQCCFQCRYPRAGQMVHPRWQLTTIAAIVLALSAAADRQRRLVHVIDLHMRK